MTDTKLLKKIIKRSGLKLKYIAEQLGLTPYGLALKINNIYEFKVSEIIKMCDILHLSVDEKERVFFANKRHLQ